MFCFCAFVSVFVAKKEHLWLIGKIKWEVLRCYCYPVTRPHCPHHPYHPFFSAFYFWRAILEQFVLVVISYSWEYSSILVGVKASILLQFYRIKHIHRYKAQNFTPFPLDIVLEDAFDHLDHLERRNEGRSNFVLCLKIKCHILIIQFPNWDGTPGKITLESWKVRNSRVFYLWNMQIPPSPIWPTISPVFRNEAKSFLNILSRTQDTLCAISLHTFLIENMLEHLSPVV